MPKTKYTMAGDVIELRANAVTIHGRKEDRIADCEVVVLLAETKADLRDDEAQKYTLVFKSAKQIDAFARELGRHRLAVWPMHN
ncbi:MAG: hypothetical protein V3W41_12850 [Planctomycetota bacterium]